MDIYNCKATNNGVCAGHAIKNRRTALNIIIFLLLVFLFIFPGCRVIDDITADSTDNYSGTTTSLSSVGSLMPTDFTGHEKNAVDDDSFTVVILPDTEEYSDNYPATYYALTNWIVQNAFNKNIEFVLTVGDYVNDSLISQWQTADTAFDTLDNHSIPYCVTLGNHDYNTNADPERDSSNFNRFFGTSRFSSQSWYGGGYPEGKNDNSYYFFESGDLNFLVLSLEFAPRKDTLAWAADIVNSYPDYRVIIVTHGYLWTVNYAPFHANVTTYYDLVGSDGTTLFNEFISRYSNIFMVVSGHCGGDSLRAITANDGHTIYEVLIDYQYETNGGNGWFKTMEFSPSMGSILITPHTVLSDVSSFSQTDYYSSDPADHINIISYDMTTMPDFTEDVNPIGFNDRTINFTSSGNQTSPKIAHTASGYSIAAWQDDSDNDGNFNIKIRGFTPDGVEYFEEMTINSNTSGTHINPSIAADSSGNAVVVWEDDSDEDGFYDIKMSGYTINGSCRFSDYTVNSASNGQHINPCVAMDSTGRFIVVWQYNANSSSEIFMKGFDETGKEYFSQRKVNNISDGDQANPDVDVLSDGNFIVVWEDDNNGDGFYKIYMRGFNFSTSPSEYIREREVNSDGEGQQLDPAVSKLTGGGFVAAWEDDGDRDGFYEIYIGGFDSTGSQYFIQKAASNADLGQQYNPAVASDDDGYFAITWQDGPHHGHNIMARAFNQSGAEIMEQVTVNKDPDGKHIAPDITIGTEGRVVIVWTDDTDCDRYDEILGRGAYDFIFEIYYGD